ncbi:3-hydroxy-2-methylbutyryl-CoA dehydrogenase [Azospirillum thiophilum]|uniref:3-hydroxy-2-methylbutyryl-CoA dehydrogenase n=1 Tax=Azospirillum thiophilum TaxID=528244 RepID=A0AAC8ZVJ9_9PROT|nr:SDR family NAD(P)-dependent oxidoreductase [Azospirillum thiophilum]ALG73597.1 3-hydroxy-2-methylbutyryl-CoA dehydrogenase [Azospirillum thiophilum]KJR62986.1 3-hydroxy-2-methylbutyryl-CoA dehydrogenase [Azospirillum thiophilum]
MNPSTHPVIVTGAASGLGAATARAFAEAGSKVALLDLSADRLASVAAETGGLAIPCDVTDAASAERAVAMATAAHGPARILVNCAGIAPAGRIVGRDGPQPLDEFARVVSVNLIGTFNLMRLAAAAMTTLEPLEDGERGVIVNTASVAAYEGQIGQAAYAASKGGVASLTLPAARELARHGVRVAAIAPGLFGTPMVTAMPQEVQDAIVANIPFPHRFGKPEEYARMVLSIVGNPMVNGSVIRLDAALRMQPK